MTKHVLRACALAGILSIELLRAASALACGGGYGVDIEVDDAQSVALSYRDGIETYVFQPAFCGGGASFGLILPIPSTLEDDPSVTDRDLFAALTELSAPTIEVEEICRPEGSRGAGGASDGGASDADDFGSSVDVVGGGRVDIFDWVLLEAESASDLTSWLDENAFPYDAHSMATFTTYIDEDFAFVAFKVAEDALDGNGCGTFGPIMLRFASDAPIVPLRIATAHEDATWTLFRWRVFALGDAQLETVPGNFEGESELRFSGAIDEDALEQWPALAALAEPGDRLTELGVEFEGNSVVGDLELREAPTDDFRRTVYATRFVTCEEDDDGCSVSSPRAGFASWYAIAAALLIVVQRRRRSR